MSTSPRAASSKAPPAQEPDPRQPSAFGRARPWLLLALVLLASAQTGHRILTKHAPGCTAYTPVDGPWLVAHAGGGLSDRIYANNIAAFDRSYAHGIRVMEMDFHQLPFGLMRAGHDPSDLLDPREAWLGPVLDWLRRHPDARLVVDMKSDNLRGLSLIARRAPDLRARLIPIVYHKEEYAAVRAIGMALPIYGQFRGTDAGWLAFANSHAFTAVTLSAANIAQAHSVTAPVMVYANTPPPAGYRVDAIITDCLVPGRQSRAPTDPTDPAGPPAPPRGTR